jgi:hypothetical protein
LSHYGSLPVVYAQIWEDLQTTGIQEASIAGHKTDSACFLLAIHFLKAYPTETEQAGVFRVCEKTARKWGWFFAGKIQALKGSKVSLLSAAGTTLF